ncbi:hypothetical protein QBC40DRAFT_269718 [Triangularia verruculosa]|uniref:Uncharacterized protein n=1 Tax=Triangularia verruculosa TaxID=2587418 RepID=A0AAN6XA93_9PEZI|nr:hypothetical protein QBC40DRAFT_269718 [Triangularia verruculosa]
MLGFAGGLERAAAAAQTDDVLHFTEQPRVTANAFLPPRIPAPKAWQRVAVNPASGHGRQSKIWKRVPGLSVSNPARDAYLRDMAELEDTRGQNPRKRVRGGSHVPAYGDAKWAIRPRSARLIGRVDLGEARAFVNKVNAESEASATSLPSSHTTFPDHQLSWVPRKRHNSRWPIPPNMDRATDFEIPPAAAPAEPTTQVDEKASLNRSTRRLSRRFTLPPGGEESPRKLLMPRLSPAKKSVPALSPVKRAPAITMLSPIKVSDSPLRTFRIHATPTKVVLESPKTSPPEKSPSKSSPATTTPGTMLPPPTATPRAPILQEQHSDSPVPLIFDQPVADSTVEPQHEARRRISLAAARRTERKSLRLDAVRNSPNRRHSLNSLSAIIAEASDNGKGRRSTLGSGLLFDITGRKEKKGVIEVDAKTNLDIFSQPSKAVASTPRRETSSAGALDETPLPSAPLDGFFSPLMTDISGTTGTAQVNGASPQQEPEQAVGNPAPCVTYAEEEPSVLEDSAPLPASIEESPTDEHQPAQIEESPLQEEQAEAVEETPVYEHEPAEGDISFTPYEPEGLSTIYEESTIIDSPMKSPRKSPIKTTLAPGLQETSVIVEEHEAISFIEPTIVLKTPESSCIEKEQMVVVPSTPRSARIAPASPSTPLQNHDLDAVLQLSIKRSVKRSARKEDVSRFNALDGSPSAPGHHEDSFASIDDLSELSDLSTCDVDMSTDLVVTTSTTRPRVESPQQQPHDSPISSPSPAEPEFDAKEEELSLLETSPLPVAQSFESNASTVVDAVILEAGESDPKDPVDVEKTASSAPEFDNTSLTVSPLSPQETPIMSEEEGLAPGTPTQATPVEQGEEQGNVSTPKQRTGEIVNASEPSGFTPVNGRQTSPSQWTQPAVTTLPEDTEEAQSDDLDEDEVVEQDVVDEASDELTMAVDDDLTFSVPPPQVENDTIQLQARHDDSEAELLRKFVTRVTADRNAKAAAAAAAAASTTQNPRLKRRSGSMSTLTSSTGSPMTKAEADAPTDRKPLGEKSPNSPSPVKKRKLEDMKDNHAKDVVAPKDAPDSPSQAPAPKRRKKRVLGSTENALDKSAPAAAAVPPPDDEAPRRSTRARSTRNLRPTAPSANSIALSLIPVRLPGMGAMDDGTMDTHLNMARQRNDEKDLATMTRVNTRKNKGNAVHPAVILAKHAEDSSWKTKEAEPKEPRTQADRTVKNVRWAEELASYQGESPVLPAADANEAESKPVATASFMKQAIIADDDDMDELAIPTITEVPLPPSVAKAAASAAENKPEPPRTRTRKVVATAASSFTPAPKAAARKTAASKAEAPKTAPKVDAPKTAPKADAPKTAAAKAAAPVAASTRRSTRSTRLQTPTPMKKVVSAESTTAPKRSIPSRAKTALPKPAASTSTAATTVPAATAPASGIKKAAGRPTKRTDVAKLGMTVNGTPAPKRRGRPAASSS